MDLHAELDALLRLPRQAAEGHALLRIVARRIVIVAGGDLVPSTVPVPFRMVSSNFNMNPSQDLVQKMCKFKKTCQRWNTVDPTFVGT